LIVEYQRTFTDPFNKPYILSQENFENGYYLYFKAYPYHQLKDPRSGKNNLIEMKKLDHIKYYYTIYIDLGQEMLNSKFNYSKEYAISIVNSLPENSLFRILALPAPGISLEDEFSFIETNDENRNSAISFINSLRPVLDKSIIAEYFWKNKSNHGDEILDNLIFISLVQPKFKYESIQYVERKMRRYYLIDLNFSNDLEFINVFENELSGLYVKTENEMDVYSNVKRIIEKSLEPYIQITNFTIPSIYGHHFLYNKLTSKNDVELKSSFRSCKDGIELFFEFQNFEDTQVFREEIIIDGKTEVVQNYQYSESFFKTIFIEYVFDGLVNTIECKFNMDDIIQNDNNLFFFNNLFYCNYIFEETISLYCYTSASLVSINNVANYMFKIIYGDECLGERGWPVDTRMAIVKSDILEIFPKIQNTIDSDWTSDSNQIDFNMKLFDLANQNKIGYEIKIKKKESQGSDKYHELIMNKFNPKTKILDFDEQFLFTKLKVDKKLYMEYLNKLKEGSKKLFGSAFNKIEDTKTKN
jgi:hypothetical protein